MEPPEIGATDSSWSRTLLKHFKPLGSSKNHESVMMMTIEVSKTHVHSAILVTIKGWIGFKQETDILLL